MLANKKSCLSSVCGVSLIGHVTLIFRSSHFQVYTRIHLRAPVQEPRIHSPSKNSLISQLARSTVIGQLLTIVTPPFPNPISVARGYQAVATATMAPVASFMGAGFSVGVRC